LRAPEQPPESLTVVLSCSQEGSVSLRIPERGAPGEGELPRGDLELTLCEADVASPCVRSEPPPRPNHGSQTWLLWVTALVLLCLVYVVLSAL
jgi:hypothetical protein